MCLYLFSLSPLQYFWSDLNFLATFISFSHKIDSWYSISSFKNKKSNIFSIAVFKKLRVTFPICHYKSCHFCVFPVWRHISENTQNIKGSKSINFSNLPSLCPSLCISLKLLFYGNFIFKLEKPLKTYYYNILHYESLVFLKTQMRRLVQNKLE